MSDEKAAISTTTTLQDAVKNTGIPEAEMPVDISLKEKQGAGEPGDPESGRDSEDDTRRNTLDVSARPKEGERTSPKDLEAGLGGAAEKDGHIIVDWDGPDDPGNPRK